MSKNRSLRLACLLVVLTPIVWAGAAQAQSKYSITSGGAQGQIGDGLPIPIQDPTTMVPPTGLGAQKGTGIMYPPLLMPAKAGAVITQTLTMVGVPMQMKAKPGTIRKVAGATGIGKVALNNPNVFQVETMLSFSGPGPAFGTATFMAGGRTGAATTTWFGPPGVSTATYTKTAGKFQFGGPSRTKVGIVGTPIRVWAHKTMAPCKHTSLAGPDAACASAVLGAFPGALGVAGGTVIPTGGGMGITDMTPGGPAPMSPAVAGVNAGPFGTIISFMSLLMTGPANQTNMATSEGFPWTTGMISLVAPLAKGGAESFMITGMDARNAAGEGVITLVAGSLSTRTASGDNANKNWLQLPEPGAVLGAAAALAMLGVCHGLARRRSR